MDHPVQILIFQINSLGKYGEEGENKSPAGIWFEVNKPAYVAFARTLDFSYIFCAFLCPMIADLILILNNHSTQKLILTVRDNSPDPHHLT